MIVEGNKKIAHKTVELLDNQFKRARYIARDGITPPTKCIWTRFFRKHFDVPYSEIRGVEDEMAEILKGIKEAKKRNVTHRNDAKSVNSKASKNDITIQSDKNSELKLKFSLK